MIAYDTVPVRSRRWLRQHYYFRTFLCPEWTIPANDNPYGWDA